MFYKLLINKYKMRRYGYQMKKKHGGKCKKNSERERVVCVSENTQIIKKDEERVVKRVK